jgi:hypothetical protein
MPFFFQARPPTAQSTLNVLLSSDQVLDTASFGYWLKYSYVLVVMLQLLAQ